MLDLAIWRFDYDNYTCTYILSTKLCLAGRYSTTDSRATIED